MDLTPPAGSDISIAYESGDPVVVIPPSSGPTRYFSGLFLLFWLGMWTIGFGDAARKIMSGATADGFLIFWLAAWTIGGIFAAYTAYRTLRPSVPETLELKRNSIVYDSGLAPPQFNSWGYVQQKNPWGSVFAKRLRADLDRRLLQSLRLRETDSSNRLTIDLGNKRHELAPTASEVEREWLARLLASRYGLTQVFGDTGA